MGERSMPESEPTPQRAQQLCDNLARVRDRVACACEAAGRPTTAVALCAVTKTIDAGECRVLVAAGQTLLGENRVQVAEAKIPHVPGATWDMIGPLQRNKARRALGLFHRFQAVDTLKLAAALDRIAGEEQRAEAVPVLLEVNTSGEAQKHGVEPVATEAAVTDILSLPHVSLRGLMTMAPDVDDEPTLRRCFAGLRELRDRLRQTLGDADALPELSMGMTNDFELAIAEGSTLVRVGRAITTTDPTPPPPGAHFSAAGGIEAGAGPDDAPQPLPPR
jgi:pyridoxal phosphate enzyme (YggS family)